MEETLNHLNEAIEFVKSIAPDVWATYVYQKTLEASIALLMAAIGMVGLAIYVAVALRVARPFDEDNPWHYATFIILGLWVVLFLIIAPIEVSTNLPKLLNPEYYAIRELLP